MRSVLTLSFASVLAVALVHCSDSTGGEPGPLADSGADVAANDAGPDAEITDSDVEAPEDGGVCSPDKWCRVALPGEDVDLKAIWSFSSNDALAVGSSGMLHWDGVAWSTVNGGEAQLEALTSLWASSPNDIWGVAQDQRILVHGSRTTAGAAFKWSKVEYPDGPSMNVIRGFGTNDLWVSGSLDFMDVIQHGVISGAEGDGGTGAMPTWTTVPVPNDSYIGMTAFGVTENNELWASLLAFREGPHHSIMTIPVVLHGAPVAAGDPTYVWDESLAIEDRPLSNLSAMWTPHANDIWAIGGPGFEAPGEHYHRATQADGGMAWSRVANKTNVELTAAWGSGTNDVWLVGVGGAIRHWDGTSWSVSQVAVNGFPTYDRLVAVHGSSANDIWAVGPGIALHRAGTP